MIEINRYIAFKMFITATFGSNLITIIVLTLLWLWWCPQAIFYTLYSVDTIPQLLAGAGFIDIIYLWFYVIVGVAN